MWRFFELWCAGYGLLWAVMLFAALISRSNIDAGVSGLIGFPVIALVHAFVRWSQTARPVTRRSRVEDLEREIDDLRRRLDARDAS